MGYDTDGNIWVDTSATNNGDGSGPGQAASEGGVGAYNNLQDALGEAATSGGTRIITRNLNIGTSISVTAQLSPANDGTVDTPLILTGWPFKRQLTAKTVDSVPSGTDSLGFNNAQWQFVDSDLTEDDNYWVGAEVEFTSGSNNGLKRKVIWFDAANDQIYLDFPLPNNIAAGDQYTITLETENYDDRPQSGIDEGWDSDTNPRPVLDANSGSFNLISFEGDRYWHLLNFRLKQLNTSYYAIYNLPLVMRNVMIQASKGCQGSYEREWSNVHIWGMSDNNYHGGLKSYTGTGITLTDCHFNGDGSGNGLGLVPRSAQAGIRLKSCTFGRVKALSADIKQPKGIQVIGENVILGSTTKVDTFWIDYSIRSSFPLVALSGYNAEPDKYHKWYPMGEIYNVDEDGTIDPPSGATTYIKLKPNSACNSELPLEYEEQRYQSSGSKTYTWKFYPVNMSLSATDLEVEAWYLDESSGTHRAYATANPSAYSDDGWHDLAITVNPAQAGTVYFKIKLKKYNTSGCYVALDPKVDVS